MKQKNLMGKMGIVLFLLPTLIVFLLIYMGPLLISVVSSFTKWDGIRPMKFVGLNNYISIFKDEVFYSSLKHTGLWALFAVVIHVPFGVLVGLVINRHRRGWKFTRASFMLPNIISRSALSLMFLFVYKPEVGILNSLLKSIGLESWTRNWLMDSDTAFLSVTNIWLWYAAVVTLFVCAELSSISPEISEAAKIDGASSWKVDWYIHLPLLKRAIGTCVIIAVTAVFKEFECVYMTTNGGPGDSTMTISVMMMNKIIQTNQHGYANSLGILLLLLGGIVVLVCNKVFRMDSAE